MGYLMAVTTGNVACKSIDLVIKERDQEIALESTNTYDKNNLNGYKIISLKLDYSTEIRDCIFDLWKISTNFTKITSLTLSHCDLPDVPFYLNGLFLKTLDLSYNSLKAVPACVISGFTHLMHLNLSHNFISDFEVEPACVAHLCTLNISNNKLSLLPIWILTLRSINLRELYYACNKIGPTDEAEYENVIVCNLETLDLQNCEVRRQHLNFVKSVPGLKSLNLSNDSATNANNFNNYEKVFENSAWINTIEVLILNKLVLAFLPEAMKALSNLKELYLSANDILWLPDYITDFIHLEILDVSNNLITRLPVELNKLRNLRVLKLQYNSIASVPDVSNLPNLNVLDLYRNELDSFVYGIENFRSIDLEQNLFDTSILGSEYLDKRNAFRTSSKTESRLNYSRDEDYVDDEHESSSIDSLSSCSLNAEFECLNNSGISVEEESWDVERCKSHPDITSSDEEWQGYTDAVVVKKLVWPKVQKNWDIIFADAD